MEEKPKSVKEPILNSLGLSLIGIISTSGAVAALILFGHYYLAHNDPVEGRSIAFASFAINSMVYIFAYRSMRRPLIRSGRLSRNKPLVVAVIGGLAVAFAAFLIPPVRDLLGVKMLHPSDWLIVFAVALGMLGVVEIGKLANNAFHRWREARAGTASPASG